MHRSAIYAFVETGKEPVAERMYFSVSMTMQPLGGVFGAIAGLHRQILMND